MLTDKRLKPCPFCGKVPLIYVCDDEGNIHTDEYMDDPYSGLTFGLCHEESDGQICPIAHYEGEILGTVLYDSIDELVECWNVRN